MTLTERVLEGNIMNAPLTPGAGAGARSGSPSASTVRTLPRLRKDNHRGGRPRRRCDPRAFATSPACAGWQFAAPAWSKSGRARARSLCCRRPVAAMEVTSNSARALHAQKMIVELLASGHAGFKAYRNDSELAHWQRSSVSASPLDARRQPRGRSFAFGDGGQPRHAASSARAASARCPRAASTTSSDMRFRGSHSQIVFDLGGIRWANRLLRAPAGECGRPVRPALAPAHDAYLAPVDRTVSSLCPYCGVGCQLPYHVRTITSYGSGSRRTGEPERLCVKGRFAMIMRTTRSGLPGR